MIVLKELFGKFHPLILHLPIGILFYAYLKYAYDLFFKKAVKPDVRFALILGAVTAVFASLSGWTLAGSGEFSGSTMTYHKWLGIGTSALAVLLVLLQSKFSAKQFFGIFTVLIGLISATGHFGGSLTHGEDFLSISDKETVKYGAEELKNAHVFDDLVMGIANDKCVSCHNENKSKGGLRMITQEDWKKGGESGPILTAGNASSSLVSKRIHLPRTDEEHMPPTGKKQLETVEIQFLDWWMNSMSTYDHTLDELSPSDEVMEWITEIFVKEKIDVAFADEQVVSNLISDGIKLSSMGEDLPWLAASLRNSSNLNRDFSRLKKIDKQLYELDLTGSGLTSKEIRKVNLFENIHSLNLSNTDINSSAFNKIKPRNSYEVINLIGTKVDKGIFKQLKKYKSLRKLFVWNTEIDSEVIESWKSELPGIDIVSGADLSIFKSVQMEAPIVEAEKDIFKDSVEISLITQAPNSEIFYTLDGSPPTTESAKYNGPFYVTSSSHVQAIVSKEGWESSEPSSKTVVQARYIAQSLKLKEQPEERYKGDGGETLIDQVKGTESFTDGRWLGFQEKHVDATITMDSVTQLNSVTVSLLQDYVSYIYYPSGFTVRTSVDGVSYTDPLQYDIPLLNSPEPKELKNFMIKLPDVRAQYIKVFITSRLRNPDWHPAPGAPCWVFVDEILIE